MREITSILAALFALSSVRAVSFLPKTKIHEAKSNAHAISNLVYKRFELNATQNQQFFMTLLNMPLSSWDMLKYKLIAKVLEHNANFTMIFSGTSVTAGYDNFLNQSYPMIVQKRLAPIFKALGIDLVVHNIGQTHVDCQLSNYCLGSVGGSFGDFIGWENSFDCGNAQDSHELVARIASWRGAVVFYSVSGSFPLDGCAPSKVCQTRIILPHTFYCPQ